MAGLGPTVCLILVLINQVLTEENEQVATFEVPDRDPWESSPYLPRDTKPIIYQLTIHPLIDKGKFKGSVNVQLRTSQPKKHFMLHSSSLNVTKIKVFSDKNKVELHNSLFYEPHDFLVLNLTNEVPEGVYNISMDFSGNLTDEINSFYRSRYTSKNNKTRYLATTKFEPHYARKTFPCFDEPIFKAMFDIDVVVPAEANFSALSNMDQKEEVLDHPSEGWKSVKFHRSPIMSTYGVCFIISQFENHDPISTKSGVKVRVFARPGLEDKMTYSRDIAVKALEFFEEYLQVKYTLPKLDLIAIPDFISGAMENWGLITFRETSVTINPGVSSFMDNWAVTKTVCHEIAHMWFGNLVTMKWWDDIWLNEGFATYMAAKCVQELRPDLIDEEMELLKKLHPALAFDASESSHPLIYNVTKLKYLPSIFDHIAYKKGYSVLKMLEDIMGPKAFREGLTSYLNKYTYSSANSEDLWTSLQQYATDVNISEIMSPWTKRKGYPVVTVIKDGTDLILKQERFQVDGPSANKEFKKVDAESNNKSNSSKMNYRWHIPITYVTKDATDEIQRAFFFANNETLVLTQISEKGCKINKNQVGYFRVNYPVEMWQQFEHLLNENSSMLSWEDRSNLIDDAFSLANANYIQYDIPLSLLSYLKRDFEMHMAPWKVTAKHLNEMKKKLQGTAASDLFFKYARSIISPALNSTLRRLKNITKSKELDQRSATIITLACSLKHPQSIRTVRNLFNQWINGQSLNLYTDIKSTIYRYGFGGGDEEAKWDKVWSLYLKEKDPQELNQLRKALVSVKSPDILKRYLQLAKNESLVRSQDFLTILRTMAQKRSSNGIAWDFIREEWDYLEKKFKGHEKRLAQVIYSAVGNFKSEDKLKQVEQFFKDHPTAAFGFSGDSRAQQSIKHNIHWQERNVKKIKNWLKYTLNID